MGGNRDVNLDEAKKNPLWPILVELAHSLTMYKAHKRYVINVFLKEKPNATVKEASLELGIPLGEAMVIFSEILGEKGRKEAKASPRFLNFF